MVLLGCRGDTSPVVLVHTSLAGLAGDDNTIAPPFLGVNLMQLLLLLMTRDVGDLADGDVSLSVGDNASWRKILSLRRLYHSLPQKPD